MEELWIASSSTLRESLARESLACETRQRSITSISKITFAVSEVVDSAHLETSVVKRALGSKRPCYTLLVGESNYRAVQSTSPIQ